MRAAFLLSLLAGGCAHAVRFEPLAPGVWRHITESRGISANGLLVEGDGASLLVDTGWSDADARRLFAFAARRGRPVREVMVTHAHEDRTGGVGYALTHGAHVHALAATIEHARARDRPVPDTPLVSPSTLAVAGARVEVFYPGTGHSDDNVVVWVPAARVLFGGCFLKSATAADLGNVADANLAAWRDSLAAVRVRYPDPAVVVPGHGAPGGDPIAHTLALLR
jgi:glyoxylase-like metal-dependent hydrolase (beta-lactamase superfamily II)